MKSFLQQSFRLSSDKAKAFIIFLLFSLLSSTLTAQNWDQIIKVAASDRATGDFLGYSVSISGDYAIVGAHLEDEDVNGANTMSGAGSAYIFKRTGATWTQEAKIVASDRAESDRFGYSVAISGDYVIVGANLEDEDAVGANNKSNSGSAYIFKRTGTTWTQQAKIVASDRASGDVFGKSVSISGDYAIVGSNSNKDATGGNEMFYAGSAYIFKRTGTSWAQEAKIVASDRAEFNFFGTSVSISGDYAIVGSNSDKDATGGNALSGAGAAYIFKRTGTTWGQEAKIVASDRAADDNFGYSVAISGDYAIVGSVFNDKDATGGNAISDAGSAYIFKRTGTTWAQEAKVVASDRAVDDNFGNAVAISGNYAIVGSAYSDKDATGGNALFDAGSAYIFKRTGTTWAQEAKVVASDRAASDNFGYSVAIDGNYAMIPAPSNSTDAEGSNSMSDVGSAYFFNRTVALPVELLNFTAKNTEGGNLLTWTTANEVNNKGFEVERLNATGDRWDILGFVASNDKADTYNFVDNAPLSTSYYRLRQLDNDGTETFSKVVSVTINKNNKLIIYPNPVSNILTVETEQKGDFQIFNLLGQQVLNGKTVQRIDLSALPQGTYFLKVGAEQVKFIKD